MWRTREERQASVGERLGLVVTVIVLWNTLYMNAAIEHLRSRDEQDRDEDVVRLWPLGWEHINFLGRYSFSLADPVARGELRSLSVPIPLPESLAPA